MHSVHPERFSEMWYFKKLHNLKHITELFHGITVFCLGLKWVRIFVGWSALHGWNIDSNMVSWKLFYCILFQITFCSLSKQHTYLETKLCCHGFFKSIENYAKSSLLWTWTILQPVINQMYNIIYPYEVTCTHQAVKERRMTMGFQWQLLVLMDCFWCDEEVTCAIYMINKNCYSATKENYRRQEWCYKEL